jgi:RNA polymerase sigma-70 factor (ECF subfamily)
VAPPPKLAELHAVGRAAWPDVKLDEAAFESWMAERAIDCADLHASDLYLACACASGEASALAAFERRYLVEVPRYLAGTGARADTVEEVKQLLRVRLFTGARPRILDYSGRGSLAGWLRVAAVRTAANLRRDERAASVRDEARDEPRIDPEREHLDARYRPELEAAVKHALSRLDVRERSLLRLHFLERLTLERLAVMFQVHRATVVRWLAAARQRAIDETFAYLRAKLAASDTELESLQRILRSQLEVSLRRVLA